jgi:hypothetical protein
VISSMLGKADLIGNNWLNIDEVDRVTTAACVQIHYIQKQCQGIIHVD